MVGGQRHAPAALPPGMRPGTHCIEGWVGHRAGLDGRGKFAPTGIPSPDRPARSESLYRLSYRGPSCTTNMLTFKAQWFVLKSTRAFNLKTFLSTQNVFKAKI